VPVQFRHLERLTSALSAAVTLDDTARILLTELLEVPEVVRVGVAVSQGAGRELRFVSSDENVLGPHWIRWCTIDGLADVPLARTVRTGQPVFLPSEVELGNDFPELAAQLRRSGTCSVASVPLLVDEACLGGLLICYGEPQSYSVQQRGFLAAFAAQAAHALRRAMAYHVQRSVSEELQRSLMPHSFPDFDGLEFRAHYRAGGGHVDVGGDWYDVMPLPDGRVAVSLGDVMGKGVHAAVVMSEVRTATRAYALLDPDPSVVLERLDRLVGASSASEQVVTMVYGVLDPAGTELRLAIAGHPPPLLVPPAGAPSVLDVPSGPALGITAGPWPSSTVPLVTGGCLLLYSDGLVESRDRDLFVGIDRLRDTVAALDGRRRNARDLCARVAEALVPEESGDDVTLLAIASVKSRATAARELPADPTAPGQARRFVVEVLKGWSVHEDVVDRAELCVSELVTNAVIHSGTEPTVTIQNDGACLLLMVQDQGSHHRVRPVEGAGADVVSGRGLALVQAVSSAWNVEQSTDGTLVWCELELEAGVPKVGFEIDWDDVAS
jgi:serine phosphatase RsbU (regulator of sigma subunit)/anti-sigma regulatory factor (Ser/Thr protein kinase)